MNKMTKTILFLLATMFTITGFAQNKPAIGSEPSWEEDFNGNEINQTYWTKIPRGKSDWNNYMSSYSALYEIKDSNLILRGIKNNGRVADTATYLTGGIYTKNKVAFGPGRLEIKAKLNPAKGTWPAFWMLPEKSSWPYGGEIDIMERLNFDSIVHQTVHSAYTHDLNIKDPKPSGIMSINPDEYNVYAVEKYKGSIVFYVNGIRNFAYPRIETDKENQFPFDQNDFYLLLDMQLGGSWVGAINDKDLPVKIYIDWIRFYEWK